MTSPWELPDLVSLRLLVEVLDRASIGAGARELGVSQPAASERLRALEQRLGLQLCIRSPRGVRPTAAGMLVRDWAADILSGAERLATGAAALRAEQSGQLRVAASLTVAEHLFPGWVHALRRLEPGAAVRLDMANSTDVIAAVRAGRCDLGFVEGGTIPRGLHSRNVLRDRLTVVVPPDHAWARRRPPRVSPAELSSTPMVVREEGSGTRDVLEQALRAHGATPFLAALELGSTRAIVAAVLAGMGPAVISVLAAADLLGRGELVGVEASGLDLSRRVRAVWREGHPPAGAAAKLLAIACRTVPAAPAVPAVPAVPG